MKIVKTPPYLCSIKTNKMLQQDLFGNIIINDILLRDKFLEPPFIILNARATVEATAGQTIADFILSFKD